MEKVVETMSDTSHIYGAWFWVFQCNAARSQGWVAVAIHGVGIQPFNLRFAVSAGSNPLPLESPNWEVDDLTVGESGFDTDFPTLGMDKNGYYVGVHLYKTISNPTEWKQKVVAIKKPSNCGSINFSTEVDYPATGLSGTTQGGSYRWLILQPVVNFDSTITSSAPAWFLAKQVPQTGGGNIGYGRVVWGQNGASFSWDTTTGLDVLGTYHDLDEQSSADSLPPQKGAPGVTDPVEIALGTGTVGSRLMNAVARNIENSTYIWTTHHVGVNSSGASSNPDRSACQWVLLYVNGSGGLSILDGGKIFDADSSTSEPYFFYHPSLAVNSSGDFLIGYSGSKASEYIGAFYSGFRWDTTAPTRRPTLLQRGRHYFNSSNWGHYSHTTIDPADGSFWTIQEYAETPTSFPCFGTWISKITIPN